ncbi:MAG: glucose-1-phosphatase [Selenomonadaceae bacterium]|nr:glucose-1-phosphatase [Selenomonadaceae bacterium]
MKNFFVLFFGLWITIEIFFAPKIEAEIKDDYTLEKVLVYSRHNIRSPLNTAPGSTLFEITPHSWFKWTDKSGELSSRGGELETLLGQYFRKWLESEKLIPENYVPKDRETRFYANSVQRTRATTRYFSAGMLPVANTEVEWHIVPPHEQDPVFVFDLRTFPKTNSFKTKAAKELQRLGGQEGLSRNVDKEVSLIEKVLDFKNSPYAKKNKIQSFHKKGEADFTVSVGENLHLGGAIRPAMSAADALILQYYEEPDPVKAAFGHDLSYEEWKGLGRLHSLGLYTIFHMPSISSGAIKPMLKTIHEELLLTKRKFTFLCGHDIAIVAALSALGVEDYELPESIEPLTPVGVKFIIEKRRGKDNKEYAALKLMYLSTKQIRNREMLSLKNPPKTVPLKLKGLKANKDGLYPFDDITERLSNIAKQ